MHDGPFSRQGGYDVMASVLDARRRPDLVFAVNDLMAIGAMAAIRDRGLTVPGDVAVAGFDDIPQAADSGPSLTTVRVPMETLGREAVTLALTPDAGPRRIDLATEVIVRGSTR